jgi:hypothetical protein
LIYILSLINDILFESFIYINEPEDLPVELDCLGGHIIDISVDNPMVSTTNAKSGDDIRDIYDSSYLAMPKHFLELLHQAGVDNFQIFPIIIKSAEDDAVWDNYFGVNILGLILCVILFKSTY